MNQLELPWPELDRLAPMRCGELIVFAGRTCSGTSMAALNVAAHNAMSLGIPTVAFSGEIGGSGVAERLAAQRLSIDSSRFHMGTATEEDLARLRELRALDADAPLWIDQGGVLRMPKVRASLDARIAEGNPARLLLIDGLRYLSLNSGPADGESTEIAEALRLLAGEYALTVLATMHLTRRCEEPPDLFYLPTKLTSIADTILLFHSERPNAVDVTVAKCRRNGTGGTVRLDWEPQYARLLSPAASA